MAPQAGHGPLPGLPAHSPEPRLDPQASPKQEWSARTKGRTVAFVLSIKRRK